MEIKIQINEKVWEVLTSGKYAEGSMQLEKETNEVIFKLFNRKTKNPKSVIICETESGWLKETPKRYRFLSSVKKTLDRRWVNIAMHRDLKQAMDALEIREIVDRV